MNQIKAILGATNLRTWVIVGSMLLLASGKSFGQRIDPAVVDGAHICTVASESIDKFNKDRFLSLRNACRYDVTVNYRYRDRAGCQMREVPLPARTPAIPFREANNARVCIEYAEREHQLASGYEFCGDLPTRCAEANKYEIVDLKHSPFMELILSTDRLEVPEGQRGVFGISLSHRPTEPVQIALSHPADTDISLDRYVIVLDESNWSQPTEISVGTRQDEDDANDTVMIGIDASGGGYSDLDKSLEITIVDDENFTPVPPGVVAGTDPESLDIKATVYAIPPVSAPDQATVRIHCKDESVSCAVFLDCTAQDGSGLEGWYLSRIPARGTRSLSARDIMDLTGGDWDGNGRLACDLRSETDIVAQIWTRTGESILINNSAAIVSRWTNEASSGATYLDECLDDVRQGMDRDLSAKHSTAYTGVIDRINRIDSDFRFCRSYHTEGTPTDEHGIPHEMGMPGYDLCADIAKCEMMDIMDDMNMIDSDKLDLKNGCIAEVEKQISINFAMCGEVVSGDNLTMEQKMMNKEITDCIARSVHDAEKREDPLDVIRNMRVYDGYRMICEDYTTPVCSRIEQCETSAEATSNLSIRYLADIGHLPSPDGSDISNIRIRCSAPDREDCTFTALECTDGDGQAFDAVNLGTIERHHVRHIQAEELADLLGHRWEEMDLSCRVKSDYPITVQVLTRTGGGALVNNSGGL